MAATTSTITITPYTFCSISACSSSIFNNCRCAANALIFDIVSRLQSSAGAALNLVAVPADEGVDDRWSAHSSASPVLGRALSPSIFNVFRFRCCFCHRRLLLFCARSSRIFTLNFARVKATSHAPWNAY
jgi:hypothetical protein